MGLEVNKELSMRLRLFSFKVDKSKDYLLSQICRCYFYEPDKGNKSNN